MSVWPSHEPASLAGTDGELISVTITVEPRLLEKLLDTLAQLDFPINPQLYHDAAAGTAQPAAMVEFPAWAGRLARVRDALLVAGFSAGCLSFRNMLDEIRSSAVGGPAAYRATTRHAAPAA
ncbi:MAG TPA: hypothetical protein VHA11_06980 [Bryobacteraceae bacterium]|nr:hypothetical protein [Bryobacteraceae bacterium]